MIVFSLGESARLPDNFGLGASFRSSDGRLTLGVEWDRVTYSDPLESLGIDDQEIDDADQFHLGTEWAFLQARPLIALRAGAWLDPDHLARANERADEFTRAFLRGGDDEVHFALGLGVALQRFQIDGAADFSDSVNTVSLSVIYSWD